MDTSTEECEEIISCSGQDESKHPVTYIKLKVGEIMRCSYCSKEYLLGVAQGQH